MVHGSHCVITFVLVINNYKEVEPGLDYFISVGSDRVGVTLQYKVDGVDLGYQRPITNPRQKIYEGNWSRVNGVNQTTSFKFNIAQTRGDNNGQEAGAAMMTGKVELVVSELGPVTYRAPRDFKATAQEEKLEEKSKLGDKKMKGKKCLVSTVGSVPLNSSSSNVKPESKAKSEYKAKQSSQPVAHYSIGPHITTVTLNYCSTVGLIINKILDPPPEEESADEDDVKPMKKKTKRGEQMI